MSQLVETGFEMNYKVLNIRSIKVTPSGEMNGNKYGASVKVKTVNVSQEDDEKYGLVEKETIIEFKIPCDDDQLRDFNNLDQIAEKLNSEMNLILLLAVKVGNTRLIDNKIM